MYNFKENLMKNLILIIAIIMILAGCGTQSPVQPQSQNNNLIGGPTDKGLGGPFNTASGARGVF